ncbi:extracellular solute-binding protein [Paenibacillus filicis]|uniref:Extracellular solute-binding protein n=1 Tax=Paenibacillus filicis TaxID=669464 RepID=A0ABU9DCP0_9BACL
MKQILKLVTVLTIVPTVLAACSSGSGSEGGNSKDGVRKVKLSIMLPLAGRFKEQFDGYLKQFAAKQLAEKNIEVTYNLELPSDENLLATRLVSGDAPDIFSYNFATKGAEFVKGGYTADLSDQPFVAKLTDSMREASKINGKIYGVPLETFSWSYLYNKDIFAANNVTPPKTLSELKAVTEKLKSNKVTPFVLAYKDSFVAGWPFFLSMQSIVNTKLPTWWNDMATDKASFKDLQNNGLFDVVDLINANGNANALELGAEDGIADFANGKAAMFVTGPWYSESILKVNPKFNLGLGALPINDDPQSTKVVLAITTTLTAYPEGKNKDVALDFLNYILDDKDSSAFFESLKFNQVAKNQKLQTFPWNEEAQKIVDAGQGFLGLTLPVSADQDKDKLAQAYYAKSITRDQYVEAVNKTWKKSVGAGK